MSERAFVRDERTLEQPYFVYMERPHYGPVMAARFQWRDSAERVAAAINRALVREGRA